MQRLHVIHMWISKCEHVCLWGENFLAFTKRVFQICGWEFGGSYSLALSAVLG